MGEGEGEGDRRGGTDIHFLRGMVSERDLFWSGKMYVV